MAHRDTVDVVRAAQSELRHVDGAVALAAKPLDQPRPLLAEDFGSQRWIEAVVTRGDRRVGRKREQAADGRDVVACDVPVRARAQARLQKRWNEQRRVSLVHVKRADPVGEAECFEHRETAVPEDRFLAQAVAAVAAVESRGQRAIARIVAFEIRIEQIHRHGRGDGAGADHVVAPRPNLNGAALDRNRDRPIDAEHARPGIPNLARFGLIAAPIEVLHEVSEVIEQRYADNRQPEIRSREQHVAGQDAEAAAVRRQARIAGDLHREIGNARRFAAGGADGVKPAFEGGALVGA